MSVNEERGSEVASANGMFSDSGRTLVASVWTSPAGVPEVIDLRDRYRGATALGRAKVVLIRVENVLDPKADLLEP